MQMGKYGVVALFFGGFLVLFSCDRRSSIPQFLRQIDVKIDSGPQQASADLRQLEREQVGLSEDTRMKLALLRTKAADKAFVRPASDSAMRAVVRYYERRGTCHERMDAYYYLGCVYRDLHDSPRALSNYLRAVDCADTSSADFPYRQYAVLLGQIAGLYERQCNSREAIAWQRRALQVKQRCGMDQTASIVSLAGCYEGADSMARASYYYDLARGLIARSGKTREYLGALGQMLSFYTSRNRRAEEADCLELIKRYPMEELPFNTCSALAYYYAEKGAWEKGVPYLEHAARHCTDIYAQRDNMRALFVLHKALGHRSEALRHATQYMQYVDSVERDQRRRQARLVSELYSYYQSETETFDRERRAYRDKGLFLSVAVMALATTIGVGIVSNLRLRRRNRKIAVVKEEALRLQCEVSRYEEQRSQAVRELDLYKRMAEADKRREGEARNRRGRLLLELSEKVARFKNVCFSDNDDGGHGLEAWHGLIAAVDRVCPAFASTLQAAFPGADVLDVRMLYLLRTGLTRAEAAVALGRTKGRITQRCKRLQDTYGLSVQDLLLSAKSV